MNEYICGDCSILGNKNNEALWKYKALLNIQRIYYCNLQNVLKARSYRNFILSRIPIPNYY
jgi:hypothetical protein